jgi:hypothetical protein
MSPQCGLTPSQQLRNPKRLDHIIVGPQFQQSNLLLLIRFDRKNDNGNVRPGANAFEDFRSFEVRQIEVENDQVRPLDHRGSKSERSVFRFHHRIVVKLEAGAKKPSNLRLIVNDEHFSH